METSISQADEPHKKPLCGVCVFNEEDWKKMIEFMGQHVPKFETAFKNRYNYL